MAGSNVGWTSAEAVNWDEISTEAPPPLADGTYRGVFVKAEPRPTKKGEPAISIELSVTSIYGGADLESPRKLFDNVMLTKATAFRCKQLAAAADIAPPKDLGIEGVTLFCERLVDAQPVIFTTKQSTWEGKTNAKVSKYHTEADAAKLGESGEQASGEAAAPRPIRTSRKAQAGAPAAA